tara:strand:- start:155 stop:2017 length:1863 start_codon:yes stop_codon:yes gene_type:complete
MSNTLVILDSVKVSLNDVDDIMLWSENRKDNNTKIFSLLKILDSNAEYCKTEYISLISKLGESFDGNKRIIDHLKIENNFSFWWTTLIVEKSNYTKSTEVNNAIKIIAFKYWFTKKNYNEILLYTNNKKLEKAMSILCSEMNITLKIKSEFKENNKNHSQRKLYKFFPKIIQSLVWLFWELISMWPLKGAGIEKWRRSKSKITFLSSLINLDNTSVQKGEFQSNYWPILPDLLKKNNLGSNWIHMYGGTKDLQNASKARGIIDKFNSSKNGIETHITIYSFLSFLVILRVILNLIRLNYVKFKISRSISKKSGMIWPFIVSDFNESLSGINAARNLLYMFLFKKALTILKIQDKGFYLQENQGWECTFINSWRASKHKSHLFAIPHTPIKFWDLKGIIEKKNFIHHEKLLLPIPDYIGVNSNISKNMHLHNGIPSKKLVSIEALRYLHLNNSPDCTLKDLNLSKNSVLFLGDIIETKNIEQIKLLKESLKYINKPIQCLIKSHPATPITAKDCLDIDVIFTDKPINEIVNCCKLAFSSSTTSSAFDAYYLGTKVVTFVEPKGLNLSPLRGFQDAVFVSTAKELASVLNNLDKTKEKTKKRENILFIDTNIPRWKKIFEVS